MSSYRYIHTVLNTVEELFEKDREGYSLKGDSINLFLSEYSPDLGVSEKLVPNSESRYLKLIGTFLLVVESVRVDVLLEVEFIFP